MEQEPLKSVKPRFAEICQQYNLDYHAMQALADRAGVKKDIVDAMSVGVAVRRCHALKVLAALSAHTGTSWTLDNVQVRLLPTFQEYHALMREHRHLYFRFGSSDIERKACNE